MTTETLQNIVTGASTGAKSSTLAISFAAALGIGMIVIAGHVQAAVLHDAAHDVRHATGFPCH